MDDLELTVLACGLAMDVCAVAAARGLRGGFTWRQALLLCGACGAFQALMPALGWLAASTLRDLVARHAPWISSLLLGAIGARMAWEGWRGGAGAEPGRAEPFALPTVVLLALATSLDALAAGVGLAFLPVDPWRAVVVIGGVTLGLSLGAMYLGRAVGGLLAAGRLAGGMDLLGGLILIGMGVRIALGQLHP